MIRLHLIPETPPDGQTWACAEIRLLRPYRHRSHSNRLRVTVGRSLADERPHVVVLQRGGPIGSKLSEITELCAAIKAVGAKIIFDLDDDLLAQHPSAPVERGLEEMRPRVRFLLREADAVIVSTSVLADRLRPRAAHVAIWRNALDEALIPPLADAPHNADLGYFGTTTHLQDLMAVINALATAAVRVSERPSFELCGISDDPRIAGLLARRFDVRQRPLEAEYTRFHAMLATEARWAVGLAPLLPGEFNDAKSDIKALDYAAAGIPVVVSDARAYQHLDATRIVVRASIAEFGNAVFALLHDENRRREIAAAAYRDLLDNRVLAKTAPDLLPILQRVLDRAPLTERAEPIVTNEIMLERSRNLRTRTQL
jgi:glycosyltransferase involved in cell wall biosynthesis